MNLMDFIGSALMTRVAILDNDSLSPIFSSAHPMRVSVLREKVATKFAVEDGTDRSDHVVQKLTEVTIDFTVVDDVQDAYENLKQYWDQNKLVTIQTKVGSIENMLILALPHDETVELGTGIAVPLRLQEWVEVKPETGEMPQSKTANKQQSSTVKRGQVKGTEQSPPKKESILYGWTK